MSEKFIEFCNKPRNQRKEELTTANYKNAGMRKNETISEKNEELLSVYDWFQRYPKAKWIQVHNSKTNIRFWIYRKNLPRRGRESLYGYEMKYPYPNEWKEVYYGYEPQWGLIKVGPVL